MVIRLLPTLFSIFLFINKLQSLTCTSGPGSYASWAATPWTCSPGPTAGPPGCSDAIVVAGTIVISAAVDYSACPSPMVITITSAGTLDFNTNGVRFDLPAGSSVVIEPGGRIIKTFPGGGSSTLISSGSDNLWVAGDGTVTGPTTLGPSPLPIELMFFTAHLNNDKVDLAWSTTSEKNNDYFTIQKSKDAIIFEDVAIVQGAGNSTTLINYFEIDLSPLLGISYYRLMQTDFNGQTSYSNIVPVEYNPSGDPSISLFPNPTYSNSRSYLELNRFDGQEVLVVLRDIQGREIYSKVVVTVFNNEIVALNENELLSKGTYLITACSANKLYSKRLIVK